MILLLGGTSETAPVAHLLASRGFPVLVSMATEAPLAMEEHPDIFIRRGRLDQMGIRHLCRENGIRAVVDVTHPYAVCITQTARAASESQGLPFFRYERPGTGRLDEREHPAADHTVAAKIAFSFYRPVLLTTGSRHLAPYVSAAREAGMRLIVRVLPAAASVASCREAGISPQDIITGKGPFSVEENVSVIQTHGIGCLVTKDSGIAGGVPEKLEAARLTRCEVVRVARPEGKSDDGAVWFDIYQLVEAVCAAQLSHSKSKGKISDPC